MLLFIIGLVWFFAWGALIYMRMAFYSGGLPFEQVGTSDTFENGSACRWLFSFRSTGSLPREPKEPIQVDARSASAKQPKPNRPTFYAACSGAGTIRTFETSAELLCFVAGRSLSSWAIFKRRSSQWWAVWRRVDLGGHMSTSEIQGALWET